MDQSITITCSEEFYFAVLCVTEKLKQTWCAFVIHIKLQCLEVILHVSILSKFNTNMILSFSVMIIVYMLQLHSNIYNFNRSKFKCNKRNYRFSIFFLIHVSEFPFFIEFWKHSICICSWDNIYIRKSISWCWGHVQIVILKCLLKIFRIFFYHL